MNENRLDCASLECKREKNKTDIAFMEKTASEENVSPGNEGLESGVKKESVDHPSVKESPLSLSSRLYPKEECLPQKIEGSPSSNTNFEHKALATLTHNREDSKSPDPFIFFDSSKHQEFLSSEASKSAWRGTKESKSGLRKPLGSDSKQPQRASYSSESVEDPRKSFSLPRNPKEGTPKPQNGDTSGAKASKEVVENLSCANPRRSTSARSLESPVTQKSVTLFERRSFSRASSSSETFVSTAPSSDMNIRDSLVQYIQYVSTLQEQLDHKKLLIQAKKTILSEYQARLKVFPQTVENMRRELQELQAYYKETSLKLVNTRMQEEKLQPTYASCMSRFDVRLQESKLREEVQKSANTEKRLSQETKVEKELSSSLIREVSECQASCPQIMDTMATLLTNLEKSIATKIEKLIVAEADPSLYYVEAVKKLTEQSELQLHGMKQTLHDARERDELESILKTTNEKDCREHLRLHTRQIDEHIQEVITEIQHERETLLRDITRLRDSNRERAACLRSGRMEAPQLYNGLHGAPYLGPLREVFLSAKNSTKPFPDPIVKSPSRIRRATSQITFEKSENEIEMEKTNAESKTQRDELKRLLQKSLTERNRVETAIRRINEKKRKQLNHQRQTLLELEISDLETRQRASRLEAENTHLDEKCRTLVTEIEAIRIADVNIRNVGS